MSIKDDNVKSQIIHDLELMEAIFDSYNFSGFLKTVNEECKIYVLKNDNILKKFDVHKYDISKLANSLSSENKIDILSNVELARRLEEKGVNITEFIIGIENDNEKYKFAEVYELKQYEIIEVIKSFSDTNKTKSILEDKEGFRNSQIINIMSSLSVEEAINFINNNQEFLTRKTINPFQIVKWMDNKKQLQLIERINEINLPESEKRRIFASLSNETKQMIDVNKIDEKYRNLIEMKLLNGKIQIQFDGDLNKYKDLDELIAINPLEMSDEERQQLLQLCKICPNINIEDDLFIGDSTGEEYIEAEEWIKTVLDSMAPEWTDVQKIAYIDTAIGKRVSYTPDFDTEVEKSGDARALWKIIANGYGVCNGIAQVEKYMLSRIGIEAELVSSKNHSFVKVKNIQIPTEKGVLQGDTLMDPTWNLTASRFGAMPAHFCKSYEELRKVDTDVNGKDHECHKNEQLEQANTINIDEKNLREVYKSIGIADKDGFFPIGELMQQAKQIDETASDIQTNIKNKFALLKKCCPEFATCQNSTISILRDVLFEHNEHFDYKRCVASRVYDRQDAEKQAVLYVYMEMQNGEKQFFYADKEKAEFIALSQQEFERKFECYEMDISKLPGNKRPWEAETEIEEEKKYSSGQIAQEEGR